MSDVKLHRFLVILTILCWVAAAVCLILEFTLGGMSWWLLVAVMAGCVSTMMLSRFRSGGY